MTKEDLELIISCSDASTILTDEGWSETYSIPLTMTVKELRDLHSTLSAHERLLNSNKHEPRVKQLLAETENMKDLFWSMLQNLEGKTNPERDILDKIEVESAYEVWNRIYRTDIKPRWIG